MHYSLYWIAQIHEPTVDNLSTYKESMTYTFVQLLMYPDHVQSKKHGLNAQINVNILEG